MDIVNYCPPNLILCGNVARSLSREPDLTPDRKVQKEIGSRHEKSFYKRSVMKLLTLLGWDVHFAPSRSQNLNTPFDIIDVWATRTLKGISIWKEAKRFMWATNPQTNASTAVPRLRSGKSEKPPRAYVMSVQSPVSTKKSRKLSTNSTDSLTKFNTACLPTLGLRVRSIIEQLRVRGSEANDVQ